MIRDHELMFSDAQALTATALSTNVIDLGPLSGGNLTRDITGGDGGQMFLHVNVGTLFESGGASTLVITLESDDNTSLSSATTHYTSASIAKASLVAGYELIVPMPVANYQRYLALRYTVGTANFTAGAISATMVRGIRNYPYYASEGGSDAD
jgi:hypothetical protein